MGFREPSILQSLNPTGNKQLFFADLIPAVTQDIAKDMHGALESEDAHALHNLTLDFQDSSMHGMEREADAIQAAVNAAQRHLEGGELQRVQEIAESIAKKARRFRNYYVELRPKLDRLRAKMEAIATKCLDAEKSSEKLIKETSKKRDFWFLFSRWDCSNFMTV